MQILLFGKNGQVGKALEPLLHRLNPSAEIISFGHEGLDITETAKLQVVLRKYKPDIVINTSAYTNVDRAETENNIAWKVNAEAPGIMMQEMNTWKGALIHFSTDYVFDGKKHHPYVEQDDPNPINEYGRSKLGGERLIEAIGERYLIFRTSWVYAENSQNFVSNILQWATTQKVLRIVDDQIGSPTWAQMLAEQTARLVYQKEILDFLDEFAGIYHCAGKGATSRYDLAQKILSLVTSNPEIEATTVIPVKSSDFSSPALRPGFSALDCTKFEKVFDVSLPSWELSLGKALKGF